MDEIKSTIDDLGIAAFEANIKVAAIAVMSNNGTLKYQTPNWDLSHQTSIISNVIQGESSFVLSNTKYSVVEATKEGIIGTNDGGMGHVVIVPFQGGVIVSYVMPQGDPSQALNFIKSHTTELNWKL